MTGGASVALAPTVPCQYRRARHGPDDLDTTAAHPRPSTHHTRSTAPPFHTSNTSRTPQRYVAACTELLSPKDQPGRHVCRLLRHRPRPLHVLLVTPTETPTSPGHRLGQPLA